ncbi:MAG TPA: M28 family peptidase, partial [Kiritimatiellae bacterium]|nr:M28 family peptidase [Kiritimatiellia bacterium]
RVDSFQEAAPWGEGRFANVVGVIPGQTDSLVIIGGHYDTKAGIGPGFQGANDSGSSVAVLLETARALADWSRHGTEKWVVFFDGEECRRSYGPHDGLHGSRRLARSLIRSGRAQRVRAVIIVDMVGDKDLTLTIPPNCSPSLVRLLRRCAADLGFDGLVTGYPAPILDDHVPFLERGIPALDIIDFHYGSAPGRNDYWHTLEDSLDHVSAGSLEIVGRLVVETVRRLDEGDGVSACEQSPSGY